MQTIKTAIPVIVPWLKPTMTAAAPPIYGPIYGIKSVKPQNKPNNNGAFRPIIAKPIVSVIKTIKATKRVPLIVFLTSLPILVINTSISYLFLLGTNFKKCFDIASKSNNIYKPITKLIRIVPIPDARLPKRPINDFGREFVKLTKKPPTLSNRLSLKLVKSIPLIDI